MAAYVMVEVTVHDREKMSEYQKFTPSTIAAFDGRFIIRGGKTMSLEGDWQPERIVVIEFPNAEKAHAWWNSEIYAGPKQMRQEAATTKMILVEGVAPVIPG
jgi:uncharacterized protein (DUF1330 family)